MSQENTKNKKLGEKCIKIVMTSSADNLTVRNKKHMIDNRGKKP
jgi:hypothetical protein